MSVRQMGKVWELDVPYTQTLILLALADHAQDDGTGAYPSVERIAWKTSLSTRAVQSNIRKLEDVGIVEVVGNWQGGRGRKREYVLHLEKGARKSPFGEAKRVQVLHPNSSQKGADDDIKRVQMVHQKGADGSSPLKELTISEPSEEALVKTSGADVLTTFMALYEILTGNPYVRARTTVPPALAKKIGRVETALAEFGVNGADGEEVLARWPRLRQKYPKATIHALPEHWHSLRDDEWAAYLEDIRHDDKPIKDPIANARALIERNRKLAGAGGDAGGIHDRPARDDRFRDREVGRDVPGLSDGRT